MAIRFDLKPGSQKFTRTPPTADIGYVLNGVFDGTSAKAIATSLIPPAVAVNEGVIYLQDVECSERGFQLWDITAKYAQSNIQTGSVRFSFSTTGGTFHVESSKSTVNKYAASGNPPDFKGLINVSKDKSGEVKAEGADIVIAQSRRSIKVRWPAGVVSEAYAQVIEDCTSRVNSTTFLGRAAGEVLFLGAEGEQGTDVETTIEYHFAIEKNLTGLSFGDITGVAKDGHDLLWVLTDYYKDSNSKPSRKPIGVYVERIYDRVNLAQLLGFGG